MCDSYRTIKLELEDYLAVSGLHKTLEVFCNEYNPEVVVIRSSVDKFYDVQNKSLLSRHIKAKIKLSEIWKKIRARKNDFKKAFIILAREEKKLNELLAICSKYVRLNLMLVDNIERLVRSQVNNITPFKEEPESQKLDFTNTDVVHVNSHQTFGSKISSFSPSDLDIKNLGSIHDESQSFKQQHLNKAETDIPSFRQICSRLSQVSSSSLISSSDSSDLQIISESRLHDIYPLISDSSSVVSPICPKYDICMPRILPQESDLFSELGLIYSEKHSPSSKLNSRRLMNDYRKASLLFDKVTEATLDSRKVSWKYAISSDSYMEGISNCPSSSSCSLLSIVSQPCSRLSGKVCNCKSTDLRKWCSKFLAHAEIGHQNINSASSKKLLNDSKANGIDETSCYSFQTSTSGTIRCTSCATSADCENRSESTICNYNTSSTSLTSTVKNNGNVTHLPVTIPVPSFPNYRKHELCMESSIETSSDENAVKTGVTDISAIDDKNGASTCDFDSARSFASETISFLSEGINNDSLDYIADFGDKLGDVRNSKTRDKAHYGEASRFETPSSSGDASSGIKVHESTIRKNNHKLVPNCYLGPTRGFRGRSRLLIAEEHEIQSPDEKRRFFTNSTRASFSNRIFENEYIPNLSQRSSYKSDIIFNGRDPLFENVKNSKQTNSDSRLLQPKSDLKYFSSSAESLGVKFKRKHVVSSRELNNKIFDAPDYFEFKSNISGKNPQRASSVLDEAAELKQETESMFSIPESSSSLNSQNKSFAMKNNERLHKHSANDFSCISSFSANSCKSATPKKLIQNSQISLNDCLDRYSTNSSELKEDEQRLTPSLRQRSRVLNSGKRDDCLFMNRRNDSLNSRDRTSGPSDVVIERNLSFKKDLMQTSKEFFGFKGN